MRWVSTLVILMIALPSLKLVGVGAQPMDKSDKYGTAFDEATVDTFNKLDELPELVIGREVLSHKNATRLFKIMRDIAWWPRTRGIENMYKAIKSLNQDTHRWDVFFAEWHTALHFNDKNITLLRYYHDYVTKDMEGVWKSYTDTLTLLNELAYRQLWTSCQDRYNSPHAQFDRFVLALDVNFSGKSLADLAKEETGAYLYETLAQLDRLLFMMDKFCGELQIRYFRASGTDQFYFNETMDMQRNFFAKMKAAWPEGPKKFTKAKSEAKPTATTKKSAAQEKAIASAVNVTKTGKPKSRKPSLNTTASLGEFLKTTAESDEASSQMKPGNDDASTAMPANSDTKTTAEAVA